MKFQTVSTPAVYEAVAQQLREAILNRTLPVGAALPPERELAAQFGVSRTSVREALRLVQSEGLLSSAGRTSPLRTTGADDAAGRLGETLTQVVRMRQVSLSDLVELRRAVESAALEAAARAPVKKHLDEARAALARMENPQTPFAEFFAADVAFHIALVAASGNQALHAVLLAVRETMATHLDDSLKGRDLDALRPKVLEEHTALLRAVEKGEGKRASKLLVEHLAYYGT